MTRSLIRSLRSILIFSVISGSNGRDDVVLPEPYPISFSINFDTNITSEHIFPIKNTLYYDWTIQSQRVDHGAGSYECVHFYETTMPCSLIFTPKGMYRILPSGPTDIPDCCLDIAGLGAPPPDWALKANGSLDGMIYDDYAEVLAYQWTFRDVRSSPSKSFGAAKYHTCSQVAEGYNAGQPLTFGFPGNPQQDYHYDLRSMRELQPSLSALFDIPEGCEDRLCDTANLSKH